MKAFAIGINKQTLSTKTEQAIYSVGLYRNKWSLTMVIFINQEGNDFYVVKLHDKALLQVIE